MNDKCPIIRKTNWIVFKGIWAKDSLGLDWEKVSKRGQKNPKKEINALVSKGKKWCNSLVYTIGECSF